MKFGELDVDFGVRLGEGLDEWSLALLGVPFGVEIISAGGKRVGVFSRVSGESVPLGVLLSLATIDFDLKNPMRLCCPFVEAIVADVTAPDFVRLTG